MIKKLQRKFIQIAVLSLFGVLTVVIGVVNVINFLQMNRDANEILTLLSENDGAFPDLFPGKMEGPGEEPPQQEHLKKEEPFHPDRIRGNLSEETPFATRYFLVRTDSDGQISRIDTSHIAAASSGEAKEYAKKALAKNKTTGFMGIYKYRITSTDQGSLLVFVDCRTQLKTAFSFLIVSVSIAAASLLVVFILVSVFSGRAIAPVAESIEKQKQFITDAGHELKTPIAIISANTDVLELTAGKNEWTESIHNQTGRLSGLVNDLLTLSRMDEEGYSPHLADFSLSSAVAETAEPFETLAADGGMEFSASIAPDIRFYGEESQLRQLVTILCDNAVKYCPKGGQISLTLEEKGRCVALTVKNTCGQLPQGDLKRLFDRFYRAENSRSRETGGYGIGLSIAQAIVHAHKGKITASREGDSVICFRAVF